jgi:hypothetical protein
MASQNFLKSPGGISYYLLLGEGCVGPGLWAGGLGLGRLVALAM